jgi:hypothetical protein
MKFIPVRLNNLAFGRHYKCRPAGRLRPFPFSVKSIKKVVNDLMVLWLDNFCNPALKHRAMDSFTKLTSILSLNLTAMPRQSGICNSALKKIDNEIHSCWAS